jgi:hypothetical protein
VKPTTLLLIASLLANVALLTLVATRSAPAGPAPSASTAAQTGGAKPSGSDAALRQALVSGNTAALEAAGLDPALARELAIGRAFTRLSSRVQANKSAGADTRWWRNTRNSATAQEEQLQLRREITEALVAAGIDPTGITTRGDANQLAFLPAAKRDALRRINQDYDEMMAKFSEGGVQLASDRERLKLLRAEKERDIAALLTPEERLAYEMRTSNSAAVVRARYGDGIQSEEDYRKIYALQKAFDDKFSLDTLNARTNPDGMRAFSAAQRQLQDDIRAALGDSSYAQLRRATDSDLRTVDSLVTRLNLPAATTDRVAAARESFATESQRINADPNVPPTQRRTQIVDLANRAKNEVQQLLGSEAADVYAQRSPWISMLQGGIAFSTTPRTDPGSAVLHGTGTQSVFPVTPPVPAGAAGTRQVVFSSAAAVAGFAPIGHSEVLIEPNEPRVREAVQVMSFTTRVGEETAPAAGGAPAQRTIIVAPPPAAPATPQPPR